MQYLFVAAFVSGLLLAVRLIFFGAERRRQRLADVMPLRRSEPAIVAVTSAIVRSAVSAALATADVLAASGALSSGAMGSSRYWGRLSASGNPTRSRGFCDGGIGVTASRHVGMTAQR